MKCNVFYTTTIFLLGLGPLRPTLAQKSDVPATVPFQLVGNTIFVEAVADGKPGIYILDTGAPNTFFNSAHFKGVRIPWLKKEVMDVNGHSSEMLHFNGKELIMRDVPLNCINAYVADLQGIEKEKGMSIAGIIGYPAFQNWEMMFDFDKRQLLMFPLDRKGRRICSSPGYEPVDSLQMKMNGHFPCVVAHLNGRKLRLGIDSGAEVNVINDRVFEKRQKSLGDETPIVLKGMKKKGKTCRKFKISGLKVGHWEMGAMEVVATDLGSLNSQLNSHLDGMLGAPFLMHGKMAINYKQKKLYLWQDVEAAVADKSLTAGNGNVKSGLK